MPASQAISSKIKGTKPQIILDSNTNTEVESDQLVLDDMQIEEKKEHNQNWGWKKSGTLWIKNFLIINFAQVTCKKRLKISSNVRVEKKK